MNLNQVTLPAINIAESVAFYKKMGFVQIVEADHYARFECPQGEATFSIHKTEQTHGNNGCVIYFETESVSSQAAT